MAKAQRHHLSLKSWTLLSSSSCLLDISRLWHHGSFQPICIHHIIIGFLHGVFHSNDYQGCSAREPRHSGLWGDSSHRKCWTWYVKRQLYEQFSRLRWISNTILPQVWFGKFTTASKSQRNNQQQFSSWRSVSWIVLIDKIAIFCWMFTRKPSRNSHVFVTLKFLRSSIPWKRAETAWLLPRSLSFAAWQTF